ncbi:MAG TPA: hypothetical protein VFS43_31260 [Polyangiaceae bacterium]|nr:hypothetical protein [Polyangiaceae bacterium]
MALNALKQNRMMAHLISAIERGDDIGHYGRLVFAIVARHFLPDDKLVGLLVRGGEEGEERARALVAQVNAHDYNPPRRERILEWQAKQDFPILPDPDDVDAANLYRDLEFPQHVYDRITEYYEQRGEAGAST